nr:hypothetical protein [Tanacetum cinerariifolium]
MRELRDDTFFGNKNEDAHDHVDRVLKIVSLFNTPGLSQDAVLLRVFPFTLTGATKRWVDRRTPGAVNTWDLLKKAFIQRYCPPSKTAKRLKDIHNFKQKSDESLYQAWEQYNDLLYKCLTHDKNNHQSCSNTDGLAVIISKLDNLGRVKKELKENVYAIQVGCQICEGPHLDKECPFNEEVKKVEVKYGIGKLEPINMVIEMVDDTKCIPKGIVNNMLIKINKFIILVDFIILDMLEDFRMPVISGRPLLATAHAKVDIFRKTISLKVGNENVIFKMRKVQESYEEIVYRCRLIAQVANGGLSPFKEKCNGGSLFHNEIKCYWESENDGKRIDVEWEDLSLSDWLRIRFGEVNETDRDKILRDHWRKRFRNKYDDNKDFEDPDRCGESKANKILGTIINKLYDEWFKGTDEDDDDLEGIIDYLKPTLYDGFIDSYDKEYKERKCRLLGISYIKPPPILIETVNVTRYSIGPREVYAKIKVLKVEELSWTRGNIATLRAEIMEEIFGNDDEKESYDET